MNSNFTKNISLSPRELKALVIFESILLLLRVQSSPIENRFFWVQDAVVDAVDHGAAARQGGDQDVDDHGADAGQGSDQRAGPDASEDEGIDQSADEGAEATDEELVSTLKET